MKSFTDIGDNDSIECIGDPLFKSSTKINKRTTPPVTQSSSIQVIGVNGNFNGSGYISVCGSTTLLNSLLENQKENEEKISLPPRKDPNDYSEETKEYIFSYKDQPKNSDILQEMKLTTAEKDLFLPSKRDAFTNEIPNLPLRLHDKNYDLKTILSFPNSDGIRLNTDTLKEFTLADVEPNFLTAKAIQRIIENIRLKRVDANADKTFRAQDKPTHCIIS